MTTAKKTSLENKHLGNGDYFVITASSSHALLATFRLEYVVDRARCKWTGWSTVEVNIEDERFAVVVCSRCRQRPKSENFPLSFWHTTSKNCTKVRAARAARLFFRIEPIRSLFFGVPHCRCPRPCLSSLLCTYWLSGRAGRENIWPEVMAYGPSAARSVRHDQGPNIFPSGPT